MLGKFLENVGGCVYEFAAAVDVLRQSAPKFLQFLRMLRSQCRYTDPRNRQPSWTTSSQKQHCACGKGTENQRLFPVHFLPLLNLQSCYAVRATGLPAPLPFFAGVIIQTTLTHSADSFLVVSQKNHGAAGQAENSPETSC